MIDSGNSQLFWIILFAGLLGIWAFTMLRARRCHESRVNPGILIAFAALTLLVGPLTGFVWGSNVGSEGTYLLRGAHSMPSTRTITFNRVIDYFRGRSSQPADVGERDKDAPAAEDSAGRAVADNTDQRVPPAARVFLEFVRFAVPTGPGQSATIGFSPTAALQLPSSYVLDERIQKRDVAVISALDLDTMTVSKAPDALSNVIVVYDSESGFNSRDPNRRMQAARKKAMDPERPSRCRPDSAAGDAAASGAGTNPAPEGAQTAIVFLCNPETDPNSPLALRAILEIDLDAGRRMAEKENAAGTGDSANAWVLVRPYLVKDNTPNKHQVSISSNQPMGIGSTEGAIPGLIVWEVPSPAGIQTVLFPPENVLGECSDWVENNSGSRLGLIGPSGVPEEEPLELTEGSSVCPPFVSEPFVFQVRRLVPDQALLDGVLRGASFLMLVPMFLLLVWFMTGRHSLRTNGNTVQVMGLAVLTIALQAIMAVRLTWAHRSDMMQFFDPVSLRTLQNETSVVAISAMLAAVCWIVAGNIVKRNRLRRDTTFSRLIRPTGAAAAWGLTALIGHWTFRPDLDSHLNIASVLSPLWQYIFSIGVTLLAYNWKHVWSWLSGSRLTAANPGDDQKPNGRFDRFVGIAGIAACCAAILLTLYLGTVRTPALLKLLLGWTIPVLFYLFARRLVFRAENEPAGGFGSRTKWFLAAIVLTPVVLFAADNGVFFAYIGIGGMAALVLLGLDLAFLHSGSHKGWNSSYSYLLVGGIAIAAGVMVHILLITSAHADKATAELPKLLTESMPALILTVLCLFCSIVLVFILIRTDTGHRGHTGLPHKLIAGGVTVVMFLALGLTIGFGGNFKAALMKKDNTASHRISSVVEPAHLLLFNNVAFEKNVGAWNATTIDIRDKTNSAGQYPRKRDGGLGYFGAQIVNGGIRHSIENDYFPILLIQEVGAKGLVRVTVILIFLVIAAGAIGAGRFEAGSAGSRARRLFAAMLFLLTMYQPMASLGVLPLTGISMPGFGIDSPGDLWPLILMLLFALVLDENSDVPADCRMDDDYAERPSKARWIAGLLSAIGLIAVCILSISVIRTSAQFATQRPAPYDAEGKRWNKPFDQLNDVFDYVLRIRGQFSAHDVAANPGCVADAGRTQVECPLAGGAATPIVPNIVRPRTDGLGNEMLRNFDARLVDSWNVNLDDLRERIGKYIASPMPDNCVIPVEETRKPGFVGRIWSKVKRVFKKRDSGHAWSSHTASLEDSPACQFRLKTGWPEVVVTVARGDGDTYVEKVEISQSESQFSTLGIEPTNPFRNTRVRVVSKAMGDSALDVAEVIGPSFVARLRPGDPSMVDVSTAAIGFHHGHEIKLSDRIALTVGEDGSSAVVRTTSEGPDKYKTAIKLISLARPRDQMRHYSQETQKWSVLASSDGKEPGKTENVTVTDLTLVVADAGTGPMVWMIRPRTVWGAGDERPVVDPMIADDVENVVQGRRRFYVYGSLLPELGWSTGYQWLGLDGWIKKAVSDFTVAPIQFTDDPDEKQLTLQMAADKMLEQRKKFQSDFCGTLEPPVEPVSATEDPYRQLEPVCTRSRLDGVLECRVSVQPELELQLRHMLELTSQRPEIMPYSGQPSIRSALALLRGDTGEIVAQSAFVPGRESSVLAPRTARLEQQLIKELETKRIQEGGEKIEWNEPTPIGSAMKPLLGRSVEIVAPDIAKNLVLGVRGARTSKPCKYGSMLGHCVPAEATWHYSQHGNVGMFPYIAKSENFFQAGLGLLLTGIGNGGRLKLGEIRDQTRDAPKTDVEFLSKPINLVHRDKENALWTTQDGKSVLGRDGKINLDNLKTAPAWQQFENLMGRPLCNEGDKVNCLKASKFKDLCAARGLPITEPRNSLRNTVATGHGMFDFSDDSRVEYNPDSRHVSSAREYLQFLRGAGKHRPLSVIQLADAYNRLFFDRSRPQSEGGNRFKPVKFGLAASWFPVSRPATFGLPETACRRDVDRGRPLAYRQTIHDGLCGVFSENKGGTAHAIGFTAAWQGVDIYGGKTGTPQTLGPLAQHRDVCRNFNIKHTVPGGDDSYNEYYIDRCPPGRRMNGKADAGGVAPDDNLFVVGLGVHTGSSGQVQPDQGGVVPLTMAVGYTGVGPSGYAVKATQYLMQLVINYFNEDPVDRLDWPTK